MVVNYSKRNVFSEPRIKGFRGGLSDVPWRPRLADIMLTSWILPVVAWVFKAYYAPVSVIRQLKLVYHVTMGTHSWGITLPILSRPRTQGGLALQEPELFLMHQTAAPFVSLLGEPHKYPDKAVETFYAWAVALCHQFCNQILHSL